jgi:hypothetical protein
MVEELVVKENITNKMIEAGKRLIEVLDEEGQITVKAAFWIYFLENQLWQFVIASPQVAILGPHKTYIAILNALASLPPETGSLTLSDVRAVPGDDPLVRRLGSALGKIDEAYPVHFPKNAVGGHYIEDAYIYRLS